MHSKVAVVLIILGTIITAAASALYKLEKFDLPEFNILFWLGIISVGIGTYIFGEKRKKGVPQYS